MNSIFHDIEGLLFDYGGTLDSEGRHWSYILRDGLAFVGIETDDDRWRDAYVYAERALAARNIINPMDTFHDVMLKKIDLEVERLESNGVVSLSNAERARCISGAADYCYGYASRCVKRSRDVLAVLNDNYSMSLVTNFYGNMHAVLADFRLDFFKGVIESSVVGVRKPDRHIYELGLDSLGLEADKVAAIGDSYAKDIVPAADLGCKTIWLRGQGWASDDIEGNGVASAVIQSIIQLEGLLCC